jgi:transcriptional regulator with XRE-family HTH domain
MTDEPLLASIGERLAARRLARNLTQAQLAEQAGVGLRTVQRLESGTAGAHLAAFLRVARVLGLIDQIDALIPEAALSPIEQLKSKRRQRKRASGGPPTPASPKAWAWDDVI